jgi:arabinogalactan endo-1,4-beta-galactosidase
MNQFGSRRNRRPCQLPAWWTPWLLLAVAVVPSSTAAAIAGADLSFLPHVEAHGAAFHDSAGGGDALDLLARHGFGWVRLRLWHAPHDGRSGLAEVTGMAARVRERGLGLLLDLHYSDTWADPGRQDVPAAWAGLSQAAVEDSVYRYTRDVVATLAAAGAVPDMVQLGNEITGGLLWDHGRVGGSYDTAQQWGRLAALLNAGARGVREAAVGPVRVLLHVDRGGDVAACRWFFDHMLEQRVEFDAIGLSYYPWWHGPPESLAANLAELAGRYDRDLYVVETAYPWTLEGFDDTHNLVGLPGQLLADHDATPAGQAAFLARIGAIVAATPGGRGRGVFYWAPDWVTTPGAGSAGENLALFDETGGLLPGADALAAATAPLAVSGGPPQAHPVAEAWPNPFHDSVRVRFPAARGGSGRVRVEDVTGRLVRELEGMPSVPGGMEVRWDGRDGAGRRLPDGVYCVRLESRSVAAAVRVTLRPRR